MVLSSTKFVRRQAMERAAHDPVDYAQAAVVDELLELVKRHIRVSMEWYRPSPAGMVPCDKTDPRRAELRVEARVGVQ